MNDTSKEFELITSKMQDFITQDSLPLVGDIEILDYLATKGSIDLEELASEVGESRWFSWTQYVMDLKKLNNELKRTYIWWDKKGWKNIEDVPQSKWESFENWLETSDDVDEWDVK